MATSSPCRPGSPIATAPTRCRCCSASATSQRCSAWASCAARPAFPSIESRPMPAKLRLTVATADYDHVRDLRFGLVEPEGIDLTYLCMGIHEIFSRFAANREWEVSELSFAKFIAQATAPDADII